jgi:hypothetical protein
VWREFFKRFLLLFMVLWVPIFAMLCRREVPMLWHASLFLGLMPFGFIPHFSLLICGFRPFFPVRAHVVSLVIIYFPSLLKDGSTSPPSANNDEFYHH